jgi:hypothetical protein
VASVRGLVILLAAILLAGCGGSEEPLTRAELIQQANEICREHVSAIEELEEGLGSTNSSAALADLASVLPQVADEFRGLADDLGELNPPEDLEDRYDLTLDRIDRVADELDQAAEAAEAGDRQGVNSVLQESLAALSIQRFFQDNQFEECR